MNRIIKVGSTSLTICCLVYASLSFNALAEPNDNYQQQSKALVLNQAELAQLLAPIALYPDRLLSHIMIASTYPLELVQAYRWQRENSHLSPADAVEKAEQEGWDPSVTALVAFENVLARLNEDLNWTQILGEAFLADQTQVLNTIQALRLDAEKANSLNNIPHMRVVKQQQQIIIEPMHQHIIYVPYYDTRVVYGNWRWHQNPPVHWQYQSYGYTGFPLNVSARFHWGAGININFNYFFSAFSWHKRHVVVTHHRKARHYRSHHRIASSHGAKRWQHNVHHRRSVAYKANKHKRYSHQHKRNQYANHSLTKHSRAKHSRASDLKYQISARTKQHKEYQREHQQKRWKDPGKQNCNSHHNNYRKQEHKQNNLHKQRSYKSRNQDSVRSNKQAVKRNYATQGKNTNSKARAKARKLSNVKQRN